MITILNVIITFSQFLQDYVTKYPDAVIDMKAEWEVCCNNILQNRKSMIRKSKQSDYAKAAEAIYNENESCKNKGLLKHFYSYTYFYLRVFENFILHPPACLYQYSQVAEYRREPTNI